MPIHHLKNDKIRWINIDAADDEAMEFLRSHFKFHPLDLEDVLADTHHPKIDVYRDYVFLVLHVPQFDPEKRRLFSDEINIFIGRDYVVTIMHKPLDAIGTFFMKMTKNSRLKKDVLEKGSGFLSYRILSHAFHNIYPTAGKLGKDVTEVEEAVFRENNKESVRLLAVTRRNILGMRRILDPQRIIISSLAQTKKPFFPETLAPYFDDIKDNLDKAHVLLESFKDTIDGLSETNESLISFRTNAIIKMLTILSVALVPGNMLINFYSMNVRGLPFSEHPITAFLVIVFAAASTIWLFIMFQKKKWD